MAKPPSPSILRKGAEACVPPLPAESVLILLFIDLRFADDHVERWYGQGSLRVLDAEPSVAELVQWGRELVESDGDTLFGELAREFADVSRDAVSTAEVEIAVKWNCADFWNRD